MNLNCARKLDYWVGIPVSLIISVLWKIERIFSFKRKLETTVPKKIVFLELSEMGSAILAYSSILKAKELYPASKLYFWIFKENVDSVTILEIIPKENILQIRSKNLFLLFVDTLKALHRIRKERIDTIVDFELFSRFTSILVYLSRAKNRVGFYKFSMEGLYRSDVYSHKVSYNPYMHISRNFLNLIYSLKESTRELPLLKRSVADKITEVPKKIFNNEQKKLILAKLKTVNNKISEASKLIILNFGIGDYLPLRNWPLENYFKLSEELLKRDDVFIILIGVKFAKGQKEHIKDLLEHERCVDLIGKTSVEEVVDICCVSRLLISHDSGMANLASLTAINTIVMFGPETPVLYAPLNSNMEIIYKNFSCSPCFSAYNHRKSVCRDNLCLQAISVDEVYEMSVRRACL